MYNDKRKLIDRSVIFTITFISFVVFLTFDLGYSHIYALNDARITGTPWNWMMYWTHLSCIGALIWITFALISSVTKNIKLENKVQSWMWKNLTFTFIIVTGLVFMTVSYIPTIYVYIFGSGCPGFEGEPAIYDWMVIVGTTLKHLVIPSMFIYLSFVDVGYSENSSLTKYEKSITLFIVPSFYFIYVLVFASCGLADSPYPILNFDFTADVETGEIYYISFWQSIIYIFLDLLVGAIFIVVSFLQFYLEEKNNNKNDKKNNKS